MLDRSQALSAQGAEVITRAVGALALAALAVIHVVDLPGYPAVKTEIGEIVDYLRDPSGHTQWLLDQEVAALLTSAETRARDLLTRHIEALNLLTSALLEQETITGDQVRALRHATSPAPLPVCAPEGEPHTSTIHISR